MRPIQLLARAGSVTLLVIAGTGMIASILRDPQAERVSLMTQTPPEIQQFMRIKRAQEIIRPDDRWILVAGGDVMLSRYVATVMARESVHYPYDDIRGLVSSADIAFANLENPVGPGPAMPTTGLRFRADPRTLDGLRDAGFDVLSIGNNHLSDAGRDRIGESRGYISAAGMQPVGAGVNEAEARSPAVVTVKGHSLAFLAYGDPRFVNQVHFADATKPGIALADAAKMREDIAKAQETSDIVIVSLHAGAEYLETPDPLQQRLLDVAAASGVTLVLGHHPHVIQPLTLSGMTWTIASMGNLVFDQMWSEETRRGMMLKVFFDGTSLAEMEVIPVQIHDFVQPRFARGTVKDQSLARLRIPLETATTLTWKAGDGAVTDTRAMPLRAPERTAFGVERTLSGDLDSDREAETYELRDGQVTVRENGRTLWNTPADWWVQDAALADIDGDGRRELLLSVWKSGNYGPSKPQWVKENDPSVRNHLFVFDLSGGTVRARWQSSNLARPNCEFLTADLDGDRREELVTLEGHYTEDATCSATTLSVWAWEDWGFFNQWTGDAGAYWNLRAEPTGSGTLIIVNGEASPAGF